MTPGIGWRRAFESPRRPPAWRLPTPDTPRPPAPAVPLTDRRAALRAAVMGVPVWTPLPRPSRPTPSAAVEPADARATEESPV